MMITRKLPAWPPSALLTLALATFSSPLFAAAPIANAGGDKSIFLDDPEFTLDGSSSRDPELHPLGYLWWVVSKPEGSNPSIWSSDTVQTTFTTDVPGTYVFGLQVKDTIDQVASAPDTVTIIVHDPAVNTFADTVAAMPSGSWLKVNRNRFGDVSTPLVQQVTLPTSTICKDTTQGRPSQILTAWSSVAFDSKRDDIIAWGGGHANYAGNEVYRFRFSTMRWERGSLPSTLTCLPGGIIYSFHWEAIDGALQAPVSAHTYDGQNYLVQSDRFVTFAGSVKGSGPFQRYDSVSGQVVRTGPYFVDLARLDPDRVGGTAGSQVGGSEKYPWMLGSGIWQNRDRIISGIVDINGNPDPVATSVMKQYATGDSASDTTVEDGKDVIYYNYKGVLWKYIVNDPDDPNGDQVMMVGRTTNSLAWFQGAGAYDPARKIFIRTAGDAIGYYDLSPGKAGPKNPAVLLNIAYPADYPSDRATRSLFGFDLDSARGHYVLWKGDGNVWILKPPATLGPNGWTMEKVSPIAADPAVGVPVPPYLDTGTLGKWKYIAKYDVFVGVNPATVNPTSVPVEGQIWIYKP